MSTDQEFCIHGLSVPLPRGNTFKTRVLELHRDLYWSQRQELEDYEDEYYSKCAQLIKLGFYEPKRSPQWRDDVSSSLHQTSTGSSVLELHVHAVTSEDLEASHHTRRESEKTLKADEEAEEGHEPSEYDDYSVADIGPASSNEDSNESSGTFPKSMYGASTPSGRDETLSVKGKWRLRTKASITPQQGAQLLCTLVLPVFDSISHRQLRMAVCCRNGVG
jgi:hypothetical protein